MPELQDVLVKLREAMSTRFTESELRTVCFDLGLDYETISGANKGEKAINLILHFHNRNNLESLILYIKQHRFDVYTDLFDKHEPTSAVPISSRDELATKLIQGQLAVDSDHSPPSQHQLEEALQDASQVAIDNITQYIEDFRLRFKKSDIDRLKLLIPVIKALIARDDHNHYYHGRLGHVLRDSRTNDWPAIEVTYSRAIELRGDAYPGKFRFYELGRAESRIQQDRSFLTGLPSRPLVYMRVLDDLRAAIRGDPKMRSIIVHEPTWQAWIQLNNVTIDDIAPAT
jgi:hypothetical protein